MRAMVLRAARTPLEPADLSAPALREGELRIQVSACGVCRTDLHVYDGELSHPKLPLVLGHEIVGVVRELGPGAHRFQVGDRVGIPWLGWTCGACPYCRSGRENLCDRGRFTGYDIDGGYAEATVAHEAFAFPLPKGIGDVEAAPLLCAGMIGYRALRLAGDGPRLGFYGFGASAQLLAQVAKFQGRRVFAFTRPGDSAGQALARRLGAEWAGGSDEPPPEPLDSAILFAPAGELIPTALRATAKGGVVVSAGIYMTDIPSFPYRILWEERVVRSVANLTRADGREFLELAARVPVRTITRAYPLAQANRALADARSGHAEGVPVLVP